MDINSVCDLMRGSVGFAVICALKVKESFDTWGKISGFYAKISTFHRTHDSICKTLLQHKEQNSSRQRTDQHTNASVRRSQYCNPRKDLPLTSASSVMLPDIMITFGPKVIVPCIHESYGKCCSIGGFHSRHKNGKEDFKFT